MTELQLEFACRLEVELAPIKEMGNGRAGQRRIIPITGGQVSGPKISGKILNLGAEPTIATARAILTLLLYEHR